MTMPRPCMEFFHEHVFSIGGTMSPLRKKTPRPSQYNLEVALDCVFLTYCDWQILD